MTNAIQRTFGAAALFAFATSASALTIDLDTEFSGASNPSGTTPWLRATFADVSGGVQLTLTSLLQDSDEFVSGWYFNLNFDYDDPKALNIAYQSRTGAFGSNPVISLGTNKYKADGDGWFDILFSFDTAPPGDRFGGTDSITYLITGINGLDANDFAFNSAPGGGNGTWTSAAHIQGIGTNANDSGWIGGQNDGPDDPGDIPEPGMLFLMGAGLLGLGMARRRKSA